MHQVLRRLRIRNLAQGGGSSGGADPYRHAKAQGTLQFPAIIQSIVTGDKDVYPVSASVRDMAKGPPQPTHKSFES